MREIGVVTTSRSDFGIYRPVLASLREHRRLRPRLIVSGVHLSRRYGSTVREVERSGYPIWDRIPSLVGSDGIDVIGRSIARGLQGFTRFFKKSRPDILLVLGDRFEMLAAALAAVPFEIPIAHIHGGEITGGALDDVFRSILSRVSHLHFVSTERYAANLLRAGEERWRIHTVGAPALDAFPGIRRVPREEVLRRYRLDPRKTCVLGTFHPVTRELEHTGRHVDNFLKALRKTGVQCIFTYPNADPSSRVIIEKIRSFCHSYPPARWIVSAGAEEYVNLMRSVDAMVGNSSSGVIEAASFGLPVVNIGSRQEGRLRGSNVLDCGTDVEEIVRTLRRATDSRFRRRLRGRPNPYGEGRAGPRIASVLARVPINARLLRKVMTGVE